MLSCCIWLTHVVQVSLVTPTQQKTDVALWTEKTTLQSDACGLRGTEDIVPGDTVPSVLVHLNHLCCVLQSCRSTRLMLCVIMSFIRGSFKP